MAKIKIGSFSQIDSNQMISVSYEANGNLFYDIEGWFCGLEKKNGFSFVSISGKEVEISTIFQIKNIDGGTYFYGIKPKEKVKVSVKYNSHISSVVGFFKGYKKESEEVEISDNAFTVSINEKEIETLEVFRDYKWITMIGAEDLY